MVVGSNIICYAENNKIHGVSAKKSVLLIKAIKMDKEATIPSV